MFCNCQEYCTLSRVAKYFIKTLKRLNSRHLGELLTCMLCNQTVPWIRHEMFFVWVSISMTHGPSAQTVSQKCYLCNMSHCLSLVSEMFLRDDKKRFRLSMWHIAPVKTEKCVNQKTENHASDGSIASLHSPPPQPPPPPRKRQKKRGGGNRTCETLKHLFCLDMTDKLLMDIY